MKKSLKEAEFEVDYRIFGFQGEPELHERLFEMGFREGQVVKKVGQAPFGGPLIIRLGVGTLALREEEATCILLQK